ERLLERIRRGQGLIEELVRELASIVARLLSATASRQPAAAERPSVAARPLAEGARAEAPGAPAAAGPALPERALASGPGAERAAAFGQPALALTDHGVMNGAVELHTACAKHGIKPIIGCEIYFVDDHLASGTERGERNHLTLLAGDDAGYRNLVKLCSAGF